MTAPSPHLAPHPSTLDLVVSGAWGEAMQVRLAQIIEHGHDARADDAVGPWRLLRFAAAATGDATDMCYGDVTRLNPRELAVLRRRILKSVALHMAALDVIDRATRHD